MRKNGWPRIGFSFPVYYPKRLWTLGLPSVKTTIPKERAQKKKTSTPHLLAH